MASEQTSRSDPRTMSLIAGN